MPIGERIRPSTEAVICALAAVIAYATAISGGFVWDDIYLVLKNPFIKGFGNVYTLFTSGYWASIGKTGGLYRPLTMFSFMLENSVAGTSPYVYHATNVLLHALSTALVCLIAKRLLPRNMQAGLFAGLLFALHPVHVEAVAWVSGRAELLASLAVLAGYHIFISRPRVAGWVTLNAAIFAAGILCKETAAMLPVLVFLHLLIMEQKGEVKPYVRELWPYAVVFALYLPLRMSVLGGHVGPETQMFGNVSRPDIVLAMMEAGFGYVRLMLFPVGLKVAYIFPPPPASDPRVIAFLAIVAAVAFLVVKYRRTAPLPVFLVLWFFVTLIPVSNVVPTEVIMTERALYLPSAGVCILAGIVISKLYSIRRTAALAAIFAVSACFTALVVSRVPVWGSEQLFQRELLSINMDLVDDFPDQPAAYTKLADSYVALGDFGKAGPLYEKALDIDPADCGAHYGLGNSLKNIGRLDDALDELYDALDCGYDLPADVHGNIAAILYSNGDLNTSDEHLRIAMELDPYEPRHMVNMGYILQRRGDLQGAIDMTKKAADMDPAIFMSRYRLGMLYGEKGDFASSIKWLEEAVSLDPGNVDARFYLGAAYEAAGDYGSARREYSAITEKAPGHEAAGARLKMLDGR